MLQTTVRLISPAILTLVVLSSICAAAATAARPLYAVPGADAPELAHRGEFAVGVRRLVLVNPDQVDIAQIDRETMAAPKSDRRLPVQLWYPAIKNKPGQREETTYPGTFPRISPTAMAWTCTTRLGLELHHLAPGAGKKP
ncbi:hypothetical protein FKG94_03880 [Exilibacterium tricleocarpae]|uniref:Uncharacterized protein n=1 Tax=Exilibacterium tricleocarpae TaxID=2591008 RepID=A0A545U5D0_9GAMM|nr:hypothetical protein [Exilibacterium tricleocarpae]TQV84672.1 hypothetical protein FKG94_03880 [Exilibacterium tricleocarpae]